MKTIQHKGYNFIIGESSKEMIGSIFAGTHHTLDAWVVRKYKNRIDFEMVGKNFSVNREGVLCYRNENKYWFYATESFFGDNSPFNLYGIGEKLWGAFKKH